MRVLDVPGARLHYEVHGTGQLMVLVPGATGDAAAFGPLTEPLAMHHRVVTYDRRGFSRSRLDGPQDDDRLSTDADDLRRLIQHLDGRPATVFGTSSGAIVALRLLANHPSVVRTLLAFEPPAVRLLPDGSEWLAFFADVYDLYRQSGPEPALGTFRDQTFAEADRAAMSRARDPNTSERLQANATQWFEHELRQYPAVDLDLSALRSHAARVTPLAGRASRGYPAHRAAAELARRLDRHLTELPGGHVGFLTHPAEFADGLMGLS